MPITEAQIATLRRLTNEPTATVYTDSLLETILLSRAVSDVRGVEPFLMDYSTTPPSETVNPNWIPTYDINAAAADVWDEKATTVSACYDFSADGASYSRSQLVQQYERQAKIFRGKSRPGGIKFVSIQRERVLDTVIERPVIVNRYEDADDV